MSGMRITRQSPFALPLGIQFETGRYAGDRISGADLVATLSPTRIAKTNKRPAGRGSTTLGLNPKCDYRKLGETGWAALFPPGEEGKALREALAPLLAWRREQAGSRFHTFDLAPSQAFPGRLETKNEFLRRQQVPLHGVVNPDLMPYYLMAVGRASHFSFRELHALDLQYGVGLLDLPDPDAYRRYAETVVEIERSQWQGPRDLAFFAPAHEKDITQSSAYRFVEPLSQRLKDTLGQNEKSTRAIHCHLGNAATHERLLHLMGGPDKPAFLFSATHGLSFGRTHACQRDYQGALVCSDWAGPGNQVFLRHVVAAPSLEDRCDLRGMIGFHVACYSAGTPQFDYFSKYQGRDRIELASQSFTAQLPRRMLGHPNGTALAVIGHVDGAWASSWELPNQKPHIDIYESLVHLLLEGYPVGAAMELMNQRYASLAAELNGMIERFDWDDDLDEKEILEMWMFQNDARTYLLMGDPAVRLPGS
ncbi:Peptidase-C25 domain-containing protein [Sulfidibacter corallicola]|uniref:Gingipain domain-containing protein n=1 Tax=Sulfidibacter corallicola TaxID=2818388 RepID=A0A8A4TI41_SULCO|nr:C25 family cysteine peptidase [Sulfidibacter corallicola]QTD48864.1 hypothetical protein J3U87_25050 [Sulfidibacter corallicola]